MYDENELIIHAISDTHNRHGSLNLPGGDMLIHAGDATVRGRPEEILSFLNWLELQDYRHIVFIPGNHDFGLEKDYAYWAEEFQARGITILNDSGATLDGINIWGSPVQPWFHDWAYNRQRGADIRRHWDLIPKNTEILVTHGPPYGILDEVRRVDGTSYNQKELVGCVDLLNKILKTDVKLHVFGHIHENRGVFYEGEIAFVNASSLDRMYCPWSPHPIRITRLPDKIYMVQD